MGKISFYVDDVQLPVNPEKVECTVEGRNEIVEIVGTGEAILPKTPALQKISFQSFIPDNPNNSYSRGGYIETRRVRKASYYVEHFTDLMESKSGFDFVVSGLGIDLEMCVENFDWWWGEDNSDPDMYFKLELVQYKRPHAKVATIPTPETPPDSPAPETPAPPRENTAKEVTIGCTVVANGRLHKDSDGQGPGATEVNAQRKVNFIKAGKPYPYHLTTMSGGWRGWVTASSVEVV